MARRSIWDGTIEFGMTSIPIKMFAALDTERSEFRNVHTACGSKLSLPKVCTKCEVEVSDVSSGVEYTKGRTILFSKDELSAFNPPMDHKLTIALFCPEEQVAPALFERVHYIKAKSESFSSLHTVMMESNLLAIGRVVLGTKVRLVALRAVPGGMLCHTMHWPEMMRDAEFDDLAPAVLVDEARSVVADLTGAFNPAEYKDEQRASIAALIDQRKNELDGV